MLLKAPRHMSQCLTILGILGVFSTTVLGRAGSHWRQADTRAVADNTAKQLRITASVVGQRYCAGLDRINTLMLTLRWKLQNNTLHTYVVSPGSVMVIRFVVAATDQDT